jgi:hypothetical protein
MQNAHLRMGKLKFVRQTRDTITEVSLHMNRLVAEKPTDPRTAVQIHLASVFGGDQEIGAITAAVADGQRVQVSLPGGPDLFGYFGEKPVTYRASIQIAGRKRPVRHLVVVSQELFATTLGADSQARRTVLYDGSAEFALHRLAVRFGLPVLPDWAPWIRTELEGRNLVEDLLGLNCSPVAIKGTKLRLLRIISSGLRRATISLPNGSQGSPPERERTVGRGAPNQVRVRHPVSG